MSPTGLSISLFRFASVFVAALLLQACGFQPLYQRGSAESSAGSAFETISVGPIADRVGQELRNNLLDDLTPKGSPENPSWVLKVTLTESIEKIFIEQTSFALRANLKLTGSYVLQPVGDRAILTAHTGTVSAISSYNILDSEYATLVAQQDARSRAVQILSKDIRRQLAIWLNAQGL